MIEVVQQKAIEESPAQSYDELFRRLVSFRGKTLLVEVPRGRRINGNIVAATSELGELNWIRHEKNTEFIYIDLGGGNRRLSHITLECSIWVELDGELKPIHIPEGTDSSY